MGRRALRHGAANEVPEPSRATTPSGAGLALVADDRDWIDRIRRGDRTALESLFRTYVRPLTAFAHRYVQSITAAHEVVREVYARLWEGRHSWAFHGSLRGCLYASTHRVALEALHRTHRESRWHAGLPPGDVPVPREPDRGADGAAGFEELEASVAVGIARLPGRLRTIAYMRWSDRLTRDEIATVLGTNARTVHSQLTPAARALRRRLGSPSGIIDAWSPMPSTREASEEVDRFESVDPERLELFLAGDSIPAEETALQHDVAEAGGEPRALDAMRAAWRGVNRDVEQVVDVEAAWLALARRMALPVDGVVHPKASFWRSLHLPSLPKLSIPVPSLPPGRMRALGGVLFVVLALVGGAWVFAVRRAGVRPAAAATEAPVSGHSRAVGAGRAGAKPNGAGPTVRKRHRRHRPSASSLPPSTAAPRP
jgi:RNA polymerase sigma factor (sigma-70 family)